MEEPRAAGQHGWDVLLHGHAARSWTWRGDQAQPHHGKMAFSSHSTLPSDAAPRDSSRHSGTLSPEKSQFQEFTLLSRHWGRWLQAGEDVHCHAGRMSPAARCIMVSCPLVDTGEFQAALGMNGTSVWLSGPERATCVPLAAGVSPRSGAMPSASASQISLVERQFFSRWPPGPQ